MNKLLVFIKRAVCLVTTGTLLLVFSSCEYFDSKRLLIVFVDASQSTIQDRDAYRHYLHELADQLKPGDRLFVFIISDQTRFSRGPVIKAELPSYDPISGKEHAFKKSLAAKRQQLRAEIDSVMTVLGQSKWTEILDCFKLSAQYFSNSPSEKILVIMSDMVESNPQEDWESRLPDANSIKTKYKNYLTNLVDAKIIVAGAGSRNHDSARSLVIERFWQTFIAETGAKLLAYSQGFTIDSLGGD